MKQKKLTPIQKAISDMMKENTGSHMLDSGGAYGRNFEHNKEINFLETPYFYDNTDKYGINITYNIFWYLTRFLDITPESKKYNAQFQKLYKKYPEKYDPDLMETFIGELMEVSDDIKCLTSSTINTYNYDNLLSQILQYTAFENEDTNQVFIILQIHGGCDARGGYTQPRVFEITGYDTQQSEVYYNFCAAQTDCSASDGENSWDSYNSGYSFDGAGNGEPDFNSIVTIVDDKVFNKLNGRRITFGNYTHWDGGDGEVITSISEITKFVQNNYIKPNLLELANEEFAEFIENSGIDIKSYVEEACEQIESNTLKLELWA